MPAIYLFFDRDTKDILNICNNLLTLLIEVRVAVPTCSSTFLIQNIPKDRLFVLIRYLWVGSNIKQVKQAVLMPAYFILGSAKLAARVQPSLPLSSVTFHSAIAYGETSKVRLPASSVRLVNCCSGQTSVPPSVAKTIRFSWSTSLSLSSKCFNTSSRRMTGPTTRANEASFCSFGSGEIASLGEVLCAPTPLSRIIHDLFYSFLLHYYIIFTSLRTQ